jgi:hypothetical protein
MTVFFGERWNAPIVDHAQQASTPVGVPCYQCERPIQEDDQGSIRPLITEKALAKDLASHRGCDMPTTIGHLFGLCSCTGWDDIYERGQELVRRREAGELTPVEPRSTA